MNAENILLRAQELRTQFRELLEQHPLSTAYRSGIGTMLFEAGRWAGRTGLSEDECMVLLREVLKQ